MDFNKVYDLYKELKQTLKEKKQAIISKDIEKLNRIDEALIVLSENIQKFDFKNIQNDFTQEQKESLKKIAIEAKTIQEDNEILIKHSLGVINNMLSGIINIVQQDKTSYNSKGLNCMSDDGCLMSSVVEEA